MIHSKRKKANYSARFTPVSDDPSNTHYESELVAIRTNQENLGLEARLCKCSD